MSGFAPDPAKLGQAPAGGSDAAEPGPPATHEMQVGPTQAFDAKGIARTVWALRCSCGHVGKAIDESGIGREARVHALEMQQQGLMRIVGEQQQRITMLMLDAIDRQQEAEPPVAPVATCTRCSRDEADGCGVIIEGVCGDCREMDR